MKSFAFSFVHESGKKRCLIVDAASLPLAIDRFEERTEGMLIGKPVVYEVRKVRRKWL